MGIVKTFREVDMKDSVMDMAIGNITGGAIGLIVEALLADVVMPVAGSAGEADLTNRYIPPTSGAAEAIEQAVAGAVSR